MPSWFKPKEEKQSDGTQSKSDADLLIEKLGASIDERLKPLSEKVNAISDKWEKMEVEANRSLNEEANRNARTAEENLTPEEKLAADSKRSLMIAVLTNARITEQECVDEVKDQWPGVVPRIRDLLATIPIEDKTKGDYPQRCRNAVKLVIGDEAMKNGLRQNPTSGKFFIEDAAAKTGGKDSPLNDSDLGWTNPNTGRVETASETLAKLRIDPEKFVDSMKHGAV
jgi:hypothetical protein